MEEKKSKHKSALEHHRHQDYEEELKNAQIRSKNTTVRPSVPLTAKDIILYKSSKEIDSQLY